MKTPDLAGVRESAVGFSPPGTNYFPMSVILIVDDEALIRWSIAETLEHAGYEVVEAGSACEALEQFDSSRDIALAILDLKLPDSHDLGLLRQIRKLAPNCRLILMTAFGTPDVFDDARRSGAFEVLTKPFDMRRIVALASDALATA